MVYSTHIWLVTQHIWMSLNCVCVSDPCCSSGAAGEGAAGGPRDSGEPATGQTYALTHSTDHWVTLILLKQVHLCFLHQNIFQSEFSLLVSEVSWTRLDLKVDLQTVRYIRSSWQLSVCAHNCYVKFILNNPRDSTNANHFKIPQRVQSAPLSDQPVQTKLMRLTYESSQ